MVLIAAASGQVPEVAMQITHAVKYSLEMFVFGAVLPIIVWSIAASEISRSNVKVRLIEGWARYFLLLGSVAVSGVAALRLPVAFRSSVGHESKLSAVRNK